MIARRGAIISALCVCTILVVWLCAERLRIESGLDELLSWSARAHDSDVVSKFEAETEIVVLVEGDVLARESLARVRQVRDALRALALPHDPPRWRRSAAAHAQAPVSTGRGAPLDWAGAVADPRTDSAAGDVVVFRQVSTVVDARRFERRDGQLEVVRSVPEDGSAPSAAQRAALRNATGSFRWIDAEGRRTALYLRAPPLTESESLRLCAAVESLLARFSTPALRFSALGVPVMKSELTSLLVRDMERLFGIALLACMGILAYTFRHPLAVLGPMLVIVGATVWTAGAMALTGVPVTIVMLYLPAFLTCVAVGDSVHIQNAYFEQRRAGVELREAVTRALRTTTRPIIYTAVTTSCGMLGLCAARTPALQQLGVFAAVGILFAMVLSFLVVPLTLTFHRGAVRTAGAARAEGGASAPGSDRLTRFLVRAASWSAPHHPSARLRRWGLLGSMAVLFGLSAVGLSRIDVHHDTLDWLPRHSGLREAVARYDRHLGGAVPIELVIEARNPPTVRDAAVLERIARLRDALRDYEAPDGSAPKLVMGTTGVVDSLERAGEIAGKDGEPVVRPWDQGTARDLFAFIEWLAPDVLSRFVSVDSRQTLMRVQLRWTHAAEYAPFLEHARKSAAEILGARAHVRFMGAGFDMVAVLSSLLRELQGSFILAFLLEAATLALFLRGVRLALIALLPNLLPVVMVLAFMGFAGLPVDIHTLLLAPIALGVVTDDTAHFMHSVKQRLAATGDVEDALTHTLSHVGRSIVINGAALTAGFGVYLAASMQSMQRLAILVVLTIALSLLADLVFTPALVRTAFRGGRRAHT